MYQAEQGAYLEWQQVRARLPQVRAAWHHESHQPRGSIRGHVDGPPGFFTWEVSVYSLGQRRPMWLFRERGTPHSSPPDFKLSCSHGLGEIMDRMGLFGYGDAIYALATCIADTLDETRPMVQRQVADHLLAASRRTPSRTQAPVKTYLVADASSGLVKIGRSVDPMARLRTLQAGSPVILSLVATIEQDVETDLHNACAEYRQHGEWFTDCAQLRAEWASKMDRATGTV